MYYIWSFLMGIGLGIFYFGGLWWTTGRITGYGSGPKPAGGKYEVLFILSLSFLMRNGLTLVGLYLLADGQWQPLLSALAGIILSRTIIKSWVKSQISLKGG